MIHKTPERFTRKRLTAIALVCLLLAAAACGGENRGLPKESPPPAELRANVDKAVANPGDIITFTLEAEYASDVNLELPGISDRFSEFRIVNEGRTQPTEKGDRFYTDLWYKLQADMPGSFVIESVTVAYMLPDGKQDVLKTPKLFVEIASLLEAEGEGEDIRDIKPPMAISQPYRMVSVLLAALAIAFLAALFGRRLYERWRRRAQSRAMAGKPAHEEALEALEALLNKKLLERGLVREFCFDISEIFRRYMEARLQFPAVELTSEEIIPRIEDDGIIKDTLKPLVREFLLDTDLVKFAKYQPTKNEIDRIVEHTRTFINETASVPTQGTDAAADGDTA